MGQLRPNSGIGQWAYNVVVGSIKGVTFVIPILNKKQIIKTEKQYSKTFQKLKDKKLYILHSKDNYNLFCLLQPFR